MRQQPRVAIGWGVGIATLVVVTLLGEDLLLRVELGFLAGAAMATVAMGVLLVGPMRRNVAETPLSIHSSGHTGG